MRHTHTVLRNGTICLLVLLALANLGRALFAPPPAPTQLTAVSGDGHIDFTWTAASGATSYTLKEGNGLGTWTPVLQNITSTSCSITVPNGSMKPYVVTASNQEGQSGNSNIAYAGGVAPILKEISVTDKTIAGGLNTQGSIKLASAPQNNAVTVSLASSNALVTLPSSVTVPVGQSTASFSVSTGVVTTTTYVRLSATAGNQTVEAMLTVVQSPSVNLTLQQPGYRTVVLTWGADSRATQYIVQRSEAPYSSWTNLSTLQATTFTDYTAKPTAQYQFRLVTNRPNGESVTSDPVSVETVAAIPPTFNSIAAQNNSITVSYAGIRSDETLEIQRSKTGVGGWSSVTQISGSEAQSAGLDKLDYTDTNLSQGTRYSYRARIRGVGWDGPWGDVNSALTAPAKPAAISVLRVRTEGAGIRIEWDASGPDQTYDLFRATSYNAPSKANFTIVGSSLNQSTYLDTDVVPFTTYYYFVRARKSSLVSDDSSVISACCALISGKLPKTGLILVGSTLYGTTSLGGNADNGTIFSIDADDKVNTEFSFEAAFPVNGNSTGSQPVSLLTADANGLLWGTTAIDGPNIKGTVFALNKAEHQLSKVASAYSGSSLVRFNDKFYATVREGGVYGTGAIIAISDLGVVTTVYSFPAFEGQMRNTSGAFPVGGLAVLDSTTLVGVTSSGGQYGAGTIFTFNGTTATTAHSFDERIDSGDFFANAEGYEPSGPLSVMPNGSVYGAMRQGGVNGGGTIFKFVPSTGMFTLLRSFVRPSISGTSLEGYFPNAGFALGTDGAVYGTTRNGGDSNAGVIFRVGSDNGFSIVHTFAGTDGAQPMYGPTFRSGALYGATLSGGLYGNGCIYKLPIGAGIKVIHSFGN